jgi:hypothetical protein
LGYFFQQFRLRIIFGEKWAGLHFGRFFTNSSGHLAQEYHYFKLLSGGRRQANLSVYEIVAGKEGFK